MSTLAPAGSPSTISSRLLMRLGACRFFTVSFIIHAIIVILCGSAVLYRAQEETPDFVGGSEGLLADTAEPSPPSAAPETSAAPEFTPPAPSLTAPAMSSLLTTATQTAFKVPTAPPALSAGLSDSMQTAMAKGLEAAAGRGLGAIGRAGGMAKMSFFGVKTTARRIAFLVDYSGSMSGPFRATMETELERSLKELPAGTEILIIPWAGGAWLHDQLASDIAKKWQKGSGYDDFALREGEKLERPKWVPVTPANITKLVAGVAAQKAWGGGTDWRSPFRYVMEASPPPDTIFFMTDGQIQNVPRALDAIDLALKKAPAPPKVFALWITNTKSKPDALKTLAGKYQGEFREVGAAPAK